MTKSNRKPPRRFYLFDTEHPERGKFRITWKDILNHFNNGSVRFYQKNTDLDRFAQEMEEIGYKFIIASPPYPPTAKKWGIIEREQADV